MSRSFATYNISQSGNKKIAKKRSNRRRQTEARVAKCQPSETEEPAAADTWYTRENQELEKVLSEPLKYQHVVYIQAGSQTTIFPSDVIMTRVLELVPLSAFTSYFRANNMTTIQLEFETWKAASANAAIPMGSVKSFNKLCYVVFLYNYEQIVTKRSSDTEPTEIGKSLLQRIVTKYFDRTILGVSNVQDALENELAADCDVDIVAWKRSKKFSMIGIVDMSDVDPELTVTNVLSQLQLFGVRYDPEVMSYGISGMSDMAVISLILSSVATNVTKTQLELINTSFHVNITERIHFNPVVNNIVQQFRMAYVSNQTNVKVGITPTTQ